MSLPVSLSNAKMEDFEEQALATTPNTPQVWYHVDDTFTVFHMNLIEEFTNHINSLDLNIKVHNRKTGWPTTLSGHMRNSQ